MRASRSSQLWPVLIVVVGVVVPLGLLWYSKRPKRAAGPPPAVATVQGVQPPVQDGGSAGATDTPVTAPVGGTPPPGTMMPPNVSPPYAGGMASGMPGMPGAGTMGEMGKGSTVPQGTGVPPDGNMAYGPMDNPALASGMECSERLRRLATAFRMYTVDYDGRFPPASRWCDAIYPYIEGEELFRCPASEAQYGPASR